MATWTQPALPAGFPTGHGTAFVGRLQHLEDLEVIWRAVRASQRQVVFVGGEPGVGKTRLVAEMAAAVHAEGAAVLWGASQPDFDVPYRPFATAIDGLFADADEGALADVLDDSAAHLLRLSPRVRRHRADVAPPGGAERDSRQALFEAVRSLLGSLARGRPVMLVLEDLHWAATPTLQLLAHLVRSTSRTPLLVLATHRTTAPDRSEEFTFAMADLYRSAGVTRIDLGGLGTEEVADYLVREAGMARPAARTSAAVLRDQTAGNPFFLRELWRDLAAGDGIASLRDPDFRAPRSVRDTLDRRLAGLGDAQRAIVELAAVAGTTFNLGVLLDAGDAPADDALAALDLGVGFGILGLDTASGRGWFVHALARQAVLDRIPPSRQVGMHARVAQVLERRGRRDPDVVAQLAYHFGRAQVLGYADEAVTYLVQAAEHAEHSLAYEDAADLYGRASGIPTASGPPREDLVLAAARCRMFAGEFAAARGLYEQLGGSGDPDVLIQAAIGYEDACWRPGLHGERSLELLADALGRRGEDLADPVQVRALASMGRASSFVGDQVRARALGERALAAARTIGDETLVAHALSTTLWRGMTPELAPELLGRAVELSDLARRLGDDDHLGPAAFFRGVFGYMLGRPQEWIAARADLERAARSGGQPFFRYVATCSEYAWHLTRGDLGAAERDLDLLDELGATFGPETAEGSYGTQMFMLQRTRGTLEQVRPLITGREDPSTHWVPGLTAVYTELGMWDAAARGLSWLRADLLAHRAVRAQWAGVLAIASDAAVALNDEYAAAELHPWLLEYAGTNLIAGQFVAVFGSADRYIGRVESLLGEPDADARFEAALAMDRDMGAVIHQVETLQGWAEHAARRGGQGGARRAARLRAEARALAEPLGARRTLARAPAGRGGAHNEPLAPDGLTDRELDVLRALAEGLSNREIGERLFITQNTTANHVRSILMKTGATNRTMAAMYAAEHQLLERPGDA